MIPRTTKGSLIRARHAAASALVCLAVCLLARGCVEPPDGNDAGPCVDAAVLQVLRDATDPAEVDAIDTLERGIEPGGCVSEKTLIDLLETASTTNTEPPLLRFD